MFHYFPTLFRIQFLPLASIHPFWSQSLPRKTRFISFKLPACLFQINLHISHLSRGGRGVRPGVTSPNHPDPSQAHVPAISDVHFFRLRSYRGLLLCAFVCVDSGDRWLCLEPMQSFCPLFDVLVKFQVSVQLAATALPPLISREPPHP